MPPKKACCSSCSMGHSCAGKKKTYKKKSTRKK